MVATICNESNLPICQSAISVKLPETLASVACNSLGSVSSVSSASSSTDKSGRYSPVQKSIADHKDNLAMAVSDSKMANAWLLSAVGSTSNNLLHSNPTSSFPLINFAQLQHLQQQQLHFQQLHQKEKQQPQQHSQQFTTHTRFPFPTDVMPLDPMHPLYYYYYPYYCLYKLNERANKCAL